jgi:hypothetical protein
MPNAQCEDVGLMTRQPANGNTIRHTLSVSPPNSNMSTCKNAKGVRPKKRPAPHEEDSDTLDGDPEDMPMLMAKTTGKKTKGGHPKTQPPPHEPEDSDAQGSDPKDMPMSTAKSVGKKTKGGRLKT